MKIFSSGIFTNFPEADYFADPAPQPSLTQSIAKVLLDQTPLHARAEHPRFAEPDETEDEAEKYDKAKAIGNAAHAHMIGRGKTLAVGDFSAWTTKEAKAFKAEAMAAGKEPILEKHARTALLMVAAAKRQLAAIAAAHTEVASAFTDGDGEVLIATQVDGIWLRSLVDWLVNPRLLFDFKTTGMSVAPHAVPKLMADAGWPIQAAMQERILDVLDPEGAGRRRFYFVAQENYAPFALTVHRLPEATMTMGRKMVAKAEDMWREAMLTNTFTGYAPVVHAPLYPGYLETKWLEREIEDHETKKRGPMLRSLAGG